MFATTSYFPMLIFNVILKTARFLCWQNAVNKSLNQAKLLAPFTGVWPLTRGSQHVAKVSRVVCRQTISIKFRREFTDIAWSIDVSQLALRVSKETCVGYLQV
ncbi:unannotated protein [freshwater metagenome]|uniref:Unannotated protein n=1 Tax=freshwater metagenome TaxID=449393 RepID=A0A6J7CS12_9ZZZZ|nr:hypothetical protein [Actinomycetota bacterium]